MDDAIIQMINERKNDHHLTKRQRTEVLTGNEANLLLAYRGNVSVGTPPQNFSVLFDTGSYQFWIKSDTCTSVAACMGKNKFNASASKTFKDLDKSAPSISYADGTTVEGFLVNDTVSVAGISLSNFTFELASTTNERARIDGIMGLSLPRSGEGATFWQKAMDTSGKTNSSVVSYFIDWTEKAGGITFGGIDTSRFSGSLSWNSVKNMMMINGSEIFWQLPLTEIRVNDQTIEESEIAAIIDTGTSLAMLPWKLAASINKQLGLNELASGIYGFKCPDGKIPPSSAYLFLQFGKTQLRFTAQEYIFAVDTDDGKYCISGVIGMMIEGNFAIIGNVLLRRYYTVFDFANQQVGFSAAYRAPNVKSTFVATDSAASPIGTADPKDIKDDVPSFTARKVASTGYDVTSPLILILSIAFLILV